MFNNNASFSSFSVDDLEKASALYGKTLGIDVETEPGMGIRFHLAGGTTVFVYPKEDHAPATFTILNFVVDDIDKAMDALREKGVEFLRYDRDDLPQDERDVLRGLEAGMGPDIAWFEDPAGNVLSVLQEEQLFYRSSGFIKIS